MLAFCPSVERAVSIINEAANAKEIVVVICSSKEDYHDIGFLWGKIYIKQSQYVNYFMIDDFGKARGIRPKTLVFIKSEEMNSEYVQTICRGFAAISADIKKSS